MSIRITLDPGHGEKGNPYPPRPGFYEGTQMWRLAQYLAAELEKRGIAAIITRPRVWDNPGLNARGRMAAESGSVMFLSLHSNAAGSAAATGTEVFHSIKAPNHKAFAEKMAAKISGLMGHPSRGAKTRESERNPGSDYYTVINSAAGSGCECAMIIEHGFHTNPKDAVFLTDDDNLKRLAAMEADIIAEYIRTQGLTAAPPSIAEPLIGLTAIMGTPVAKTEQMREYIKRINPNAPDIALYYTNEGANEGVRGDIAFAQSCLETGNFTYVNSAVTPDQYNFCGMGVTERGMKGNSFETAQLGVRAQIHHLKAYASKEPLNNENISPRFHLVTRGAAPYVEWLGAKENPQGKGWSMGEGYGEKILRILSAIICINAPVHVENDGTALKEIKTTVDNGIAIGVFTEPEYWLKVLKGEIHANPQYLRIAFDRYHLKIL
ncbi:MAG: N-acetylmuramoyl-L-alanine amidase [Defluviitaleaceae bacterium]|nr:N-acetylmuramoyl-L-alanine amidase [Defluviitaleaceae bacterium]